MFNNWPSQRALRETMKTALAQRESVKKLTESPNRVSLMNKYLSGTSTFDINPQTKAMDYLLSHQKGDKSRPQTQGLPQRRRQAQKANAEIEAIEKLS